MLRGLANIRRAVLRGLARLANSRRAGLRGLARLADICRALLRGLARLDNTRRAMLRGLARLAEPCRADSPTLAEPCRADSPDSPSRVARTRQHSPKAVFEKNVTRLDKFVRVTRESCEFGASGHCLNLSHTKSTFSV